MTVTERLLLAALALALFLPGLGSHDLWNPDEPRYAEVALEMRQAQSWFVPRLNGRIYSEKPPLHFWSIAALSAVPGLPIELAARLPSVVAALLTLLLFFDLSRKLLDHRVAMLATLVLASSVKFLWQGRVGQIDMTLLALVTAAMRSFVYGFVDGRPGRHRGFFLFAGLATIAKGPVGLLPPLLGIVLFALATGRRRLLAEMRIPTGLLLWAGVVLAWLVPAALSGGSDYLATIAFHQTVTRYAEPWHHFQPWYYYLEALPADFFPWIVFLPGAVWLGWRRATGRLRVGFELALAWSVATLVFFSLSPAKRTVYILTMYPALALLVAVGLAEVETAHERLRGFLTVPAALLATLATLVPVAGWWVMAHPPARIAERVGRALDGLRPMGEGLPGTLLLLLVVLAVACQAALLAARRRRPRALVGALATGMGALAVGASLWVLPRFDAVKSARPMARQLVDRAAPDEPYAMWPRLDAPFLVYTGRFAVELHDEAELRRFAARPGPVWLLIEQDDLARLDPPLPLVEVARDTDRPNGYALLRSPPAG